MSSRILWTIVISVVLALAITLLTLLQSISIPSGKLELMLFVSAGAISILAAAAVFLLQRTEDRYTSRLAEIYKQWEDNSEKAKQVAIAKAIIKVFSHLRIVLLLALIYLSISLFLSLFTVFGCEIGLIKAVTLGAFSVGFLCVAYFVFLLIEEIRQIETGLKEFAGIS